MHENTTWTSEVSKIKTLKRFLGQSSILGKVLQAVGFWFLGFFFFFFARAYYVDLCVWIKEMSAVVETEMFAVSGF